MAVARQGASVTPAFALLAWRSEEAGRGSRQVWSGFNHPVSRSKSEEELQGRPLLQRPCWERWPGPSPTASVLQLS